MLQGTPTQKGIPLMSLLELFCAVDDFWQAFESHWRQQRLATGERQQQRGSALSDSEVMTIVMLSAQETVFQA